jgi:very-short-patch-repair endonuclease
MSDRPSHIQRARTLRKNMTKEEEKFWHFLRNRKFHNLKFFRQHPIVYEWINNEHRYYIPDFYCSEKKVVIELDGPIHEFQIEKNQFRDEILKGEGLRILRINNEEIKDIFKVLEKIRVFIFNQG